MLIKPVTTIIINSQRHKASNITYKYSKHIYIEKHVDLLLTKVYPTGLASMVNYINTIEGDYSGIKSGKLEIPNITVLVYHWRT